MILVGHRSDRALERRYHAALPAIIGAIFLVLLGTTTPNSALFSVMLWSFAASGIYGLWGPFRSLPNEFLTGFSVAAGIASINCFGNLGGFVGPYAIGVISKETGSLQTGLVLIGISLLTSAVLILALRKRIAPETAAVAMKQSGSAVMPTVDLDL
jgi:MFS transporter, ACS family, tartrate transporter